MEYKPACIHRFTFASNVLFSHPVHPVILSGNSLFFLRSLCSLAVKSLNTNLITARLDIRRLGLCGIGLEDDFAVNDSASKSFCLLNLVLVAAMPRRALCGKTPAA
jgi:hypothetical protein